ncbi:protein translocase subunit SecF [Thermomonas flagellata]|uniref:protein translocase subunit SecF n=1 Tax=Thermomonas flagellata TaxID=2888524 RepID=UPI001F047B63|nr:protein translocase subunit SecF [Thermomonas flagellata]
MKPFNVFPYDSKIDFMRLRRVSLAIAFLVMAIAIGAMVFKGFNFALDFTGGVGVQLRYAQAPNVDDVRASLQAHGFPNAQVQAFGSGKDVLVRLQVEGRQQGNPDQVGSVGDAVAKAASLPNNPAQKQSSAVISAQVGKELAEKGLYAMLFVLVGFLVYISARFELKFAIAAIITTLHDVVMVGGWFALSGHEFDLNVLAGILAVMGFSINDTIVVFDRVRENFRSMRATPIEIMNASVNQTLSRTVITSFVAFLSMLALYLYGGTSLRGLAEAQIIGVVIGTLSSIFVACPLLLWMNVTKQDLMPKARDEAALARRP